MNESFSVQPQGANGAAMSANLARRLSYPAPVPAPPRRAPVSAEGLRIALFSGNYNCVRDGANRALNRLVDHLLARGARVRVYSPTVKLPAFAPAGDLVSAPAIGIPGRSEYRFAIGLPRALRADLDAFAPTHVHVSSPDLLGLGAERYAHARGIPIVASMHTRFETYLAYYGLGFLTPAMTSWLKNFYRRADLVLAPNRPMAGSLHDFGLGESQVRIWGRGVDHALFDPTRRSADWRRAQGYDEDEAIVLFFGRLVQEKGLATFVETMRILAARGRAVRPLVIGDGPARAWLEAELPAARFTGHLDGGALGRAVASADILVNPSTTEAFGNVNLEAMAAGLSVVSADVGSAQALIRNGREGLLVPASEAEAYADAVQMLARSPLRRRTFGRAARLASAAYRWSDILDGVIRAYRSLGD